MDTAVTGQVSTSAAGIYEEFFVPALFGQFAETAVELAGAAPGGAGLDVACGTGVVAREMRRRAGEGARVAGLDRNPGMLAVARQAEPRIDWREGRAEALPFADASFDAVTCSFGLMFFEDRTAALREMHRVLRPGGRMVVATWDASARSPGYAAMIALIERLFGREPADALRAPFVLGEPAALAAEFDRAGIAAPRMETRPGTARFASIADWVHTDVKGWTLGNMLDEAQFRRLAAEAESELARFVGADGRVAFAAPAHFAVASR